MAPAPLPWLFRLTTLCHLTALLAGQHLGVKKCSFICSKMTTEIPKELLIHYQRNQESCGKRAIIFETKRHKRLCADPTERWVQKAMEHLDHQAAARTPNGGTFEKQIGVGEPGATLAARATDWSAATEPKGPGEDSGQEGQSALGTSPGLPTGAAASWETRPPSAAWQPDGGAFTGFARTQLSGAAALTTPAAWHSSAASQPGPGVWADAKASTGLLTQIPPSQASPTPAPSTPATATPATPTQTPASKDIPTQTPAPQGLPTQTPTPQDLPTQTPAPQPTPTQTPAPQLPTTLGTAPETKVEAKAEPTGQGTGVPKPLPEGSLGRLEVGPVSAHPDVFMGPGSLPHVSAVPMGPEWDPSREPVASGSWAPKAEEPVHATVDPQRLGVLMTPVPDAQVATRRQAVGLLAFLGLLFCVGVAMFAYQSLQGCPRKVAGDMVEGFRYVPRSCGSNSYVLVPV